MASTSLSPSCPACGTTCGAPEAYRDPVGETDYQLYRCGDCGLTFSEPRKAVGQEWYSKARTLEGRPEAGDWRFASFFAEGLPPGDLLDVGCGSGLFLKLARARGFKVSGLDFNPDYIEALKKDGIEDIWAMDFAQFFATHDRRYDVVTLFDVLEHVPDPAILLAGIKKVLKPGGRLAISVPNEGRPIPAKSLREGWDYPPNHYTRWTPRALRRLLEGAGFAPGPVKGSALGFGYFSGLAYYKALNAAFPALKRVLLGAPKEAAGKTWTELLEKDKKSWLADSRRRDKLTGLAGSVVYWAAFPVEAPVILGLEKLSPLRGKTLYISAKAPGS